MGKVTDIQIMSVVASYTNNNSILKTSKEIGISTVKVRKILITEGLWESGTSLKIGELLKKGMTTEEIAGTLYMSMKNVQAYMPYERGVYGAEKRSKEAIRSEKYRNRMKKAAAMQVVKGKKENIALERTAEWKMKK